MADVPRDGFLSSNRRWLPGPNPVFEFCPDWRLSRRKVVEDAGMIDAMQSAEHAGPSPAQRKTSIILIALWGSDCP